MKTIMMWAAILYSTAIAIGITAVAVAQRGHSKCKKFWLPDDARRRMAREFPVIELVKFDWNDWGIREEGKIRKRGKYYELLADEINGKFPEIFGGIPGGPVEYPRLSGYSMIQADLARYGIALKIQNVGKFDNIHKVWMEELPEEEGEKDFL